jgi:GNAT superfamily N-acetyltransferase
MRVRKVTLSDIEQTYCCIDDNPPGVSWADYRVESRKWFKKNLGKHVEGYHLLDDDKVVGHIYYSRSEKAIVPFEIEPNVAFIYCTEVLHDYMRKGYGRMMLEYAKNDLWKMGFKGILVDASTLQQYMNYELFAKLGFKLVAEHHGMWRLMYLPLSKQKVEVKPLNLNYTPSKDKVEITLFKFPFCLVAVYMQDLYKKVASSFADKVKIVEIEPTVENVRKYGTTEILVNGKIKTYGPATEQDVRKFIQEEVDRFKP